MEDSKSILTFKIKIKKNFVRNNKNTEKEKWFQVRRQLKNYLTVAKNVANYSIQNQFKYKQLTSKDVKHLGNLNSGIACQIIRKYKGNKKCKKIKNVNLTVPDSFLLTNINYMY